MTNTDVPLKRGQLHWVQWEPGRGSEQQGRRPALIVQADPMNQSRNYTNTIVVAISTSLRNVPTHVVVEPSETNGLPQQSSVLCEQLLTISRERLDGLIGEIEAGALRQVDRALRRALGL